jgi:hypothetical protein
MESKKYLSDEWKFVEPLSIRTSVQLNQLRTSCFALENYLAEIGATVNEFTFHGTDYNSYLWLELNFEDYEILKMHQWKFYGFLNKNLPVNFRQVDWMEDEFVHQSLSSIYQSQESRKTYLKLVLDYRQYDVEFPSHDFICMSHDLNRADCLQKAA